MLNILANVGCGCANNAAGVYSCLVTVDSIVPNFVSTLVTIVKIAIPILLIVLGLFDLGKATMAQKEDEIKKAQMTFVKRIIAAVLVFFVVAIVQLVFNLVDRSDENGNPSATSCINCFVNGNCDQVTP